MTKKFSSDIVTRGEFEKSIYGMQRDMLYGYIAIFALWVMSFETMGYIMGYETTLITSNTVLDVVNIALCVFLPFAVLLRFCYHLIKEY